MSILRHLGISRSDQLHPDPPRTAQLNPDCSKPFRNSLQQFRIPEPPETLLNPWMWATPPHQGRLRGISCPINDSYLNAEYSLTTKLLPNHHYFNPGPTVSYTDPVPIGLASQHMPIPKHPRTT